jgi:HK97 family phage portal protein
MGLLDWFGRKNSGTSDNAARVGIGVGPARRVNNMANPLLEEYLATGSTSRNVNADDAMKVSAVWRCVNLISGKVGTLPLDLKRRDGDRRIDADDHDLWTVLRRKPNEWQTPAEFRRMLQASVLLRGNGYAYIIRSAGRVIGLLPLNADNVEVKQERDLSLTYTVVLPSGQRTTLKGKDMLHLRGLTMDGVVGLSVLEHARESLNLSINTETHANSLFANGTMAGGVLRHPGKLGEDGQEALRDSLEYYRSGGSREGRDLILEEGMTYERLGMTSNDAQFIQTRVQTLAEIGMYFGVPLHMIGLNDKASSWGTGIEQMGIGFVTYTLQDWLTMWEQAIARDLIGEDEPDVYAKFNINGLLQGDAKTRFEGYAKARQWGWMSVNDIRALEEMNPIDGGDEYLEPLNMTPIGADRDSAEPADAGNQAG